MTCDCENKKERIINIQSSLLSIPDKIEKLLNQRSKLEDQRQKNKDTMKAIESDIKQQVSSAVDGDKPLFKNQYQRDAELRVRLSTNKGYQELKDGVGELNNKITDTDILIEINKYKFKAASKMVDLEQVR